MRQIFDGAMTVLRVVNALALRETRTRFGKNRLGYFWAVFEPTFWILTFYGMYTVVGRRVPDGMDTIPFLATGILTYLTFSKTTERVTSAVDANRALLYYPQVQPLDLVIARSSLEIGTLIVVFSLIVGGYSLVTGVPDVESLLEVLGGFLLAGALGAALGLVFCALSVWSNAVERLRGPLMRPLFWSSGLFYTMNELPYAAQDVLKYNPVIHTIEIVRDGWFPAYHAHHADPAYVLFWITGLLVVGLVIERAVRRKVELT